MTRTDILAQAGISAVRKVGSNTVIEFPSGGARPATAVEARLLGLLTTLASSR
jgi:hypothetical protein